MTDSCSPCTAGGGRRTLGAECWRQRIARGRLAGAGAATRCPREFWLGRGVVRTPRACLLAESLGSAVTDGLDAARWSRIGKRKIKRNNSMSLCVAASEAQGSCLGPRWLGRGWLRQASSRDTWLRPRGSGSCLLRRGCRRPRGSGRTLQRGTPAARERHSMSCRLRMGRIGAMLLAQQRRGRALAAPWLRSWHVRTGRVRRLRTGRLRITRRRRPRQYVLSAEV